MARMPACIREGVFTTAQTAGRLAGAAWQDLTAGFVVFVVALPLSLGIALASGAPAFSGIMGGIIGGVLVGLLSGSQVSVSGPGNAMVAVAAAQIALLGSFEAFLLSVMIAGGMQLILGLARAGSISAFVPTGVIKGLLAAIGIVLLLKQIPHLLGYDIDPLGELSFFQPDRETTFSEIVQVVGSIHPGAATVGIASVAFLVIWGLRQKAEAIEGARTAPRRLAGRFSQRIADVGGGIVDDRT